MTGPMSGAGDPRPVEAPRRHGRARLERPAGDALGVRPRRRRRAQRRRKRGHDARLREGCRQVDARAAVGAVSADLGPPGRATVIDGSPVPTSEDVGHPRFGTLTVPLQGDRPDFGDWRGCPTSSEVGTRGVSMATPRLQDTSRTLKSSPLRCLKASDTHGSTPCDRWVTRSDV